MSINLDVSALRIPGTEFPPVKDRIITLIQVDDGKVRYATTVSGKRELIRSASPEATFLAVWTGQWSSDLFQVPHLLLQQWRTELGCGQ